MRTHLLAIVTLGATLLLLLAGGLVHATGSSLACPDWPLCFGQYFPEMVGGVLYEHGHRLLASAVGLLTLALAASLLRGRAEDTRASHVGIFAVVLVIVQGMLGGVTVLLRLPFVVSMAHLAISQVFFLTLVWIAIRTCPLRPALRSPDAAKRLLVAAGAVYAQVLLGGAVRHLGGGLACGTEFPLCHGSLTAFGLVDGVHLLHRAVGLALVVVIPWAIWPLRRALPVVWLAPLAVLLLQLALGIASVYSLLAPVVVTVHLGAAALLLAQLVALALLAGRITPLRR